MKDENESYKQLMDKRVKLDKTIKAMIQSIIDTSHIPINAISIKVSLDTVNTGACSKDITFVFVETKIEI